MFNPGSGMLILVKKVSSTNNRRGVACDCTCTALLTRTRLIHGVDSHRRRLGLPDKALAKSGEAL